MPVGFTDATVAEAYYRLNAILDAISKYRQIINMAQESSDYKYDPTPFYEAAYDLLSTITQGTDELDQFIKTNADTLQKQGVFGFLSGFIPVLNQILSGLESTLVTPKAQTTISRPPDPSFKAVVTAVDDGDTVVAGTRIIRLAGIDAKEAGTEHGKLAKKFLEDLVLGKEVEFKVDPHRPYDIYGRTLAVPFVDGHNVCIEMLSHCLADVSTKFGKHHYIDPDEFKAAAAKCVLTYPLASEYKIASDPPKCTIWIDGQDIGDVTPATVRLAPGAHRITLFKPGYAALHDVIIVPNEPGRSRELPLFKLQKVGEEVGLVEIRVVPTDVITSIYVDDKLMGAAPMVLSLPTNVESKITAKATGYKDEEIKTAAEIGIVKKITVQLQAV